MSRWRLSLPVLRRTSAPADEAAPNGRTSAQQSSPPLANPGQPNAGRSRDRNPMLGRMSTAVRGARVAAAPAPRNAPPSQPLVIREPSSEPVPLPRAVSGKGKAPMFDEHGPELAGIEPNVVDREGVASTSASVTPAKRYQAHPGGGWGMPILLGIEPLASPRIGSDGLRLAQTRSSQAGSAKADVLLTQLAGVASHPDEGPAQAPNGSPAELGMRLARGDMAALAPLLTLTARVHSSARAATETSAGGAMAALALSGNNGTRTLGARLQEAVDHLDELELALDFAPDDGDGVARARAQLEAARAALDAIQADSVHCTLQRAIDTHELMPEASVIGELAMLGTLRPAMLDSSDSGRDRLAQEASRLADGLRAMMAASVDGEHALIREAGGAALSVSSVLTGAAERVAELRDAMPVGSARHALAGLSGALASTQTWLADGPAREPVPRRAAQLIPTLASPFRATVATDAAAAAEHRSELTRQRTALAQLPKLSAQLPSGTSPAERDRALNDAIANEIRRSLGPHTPLDTRIELARVAMHFAAGGTVEQQRLARMLTSAALDTERPSADQILQTVGTWGGAARVHALHDRLGDIAAELTPADAAAFVGTLERTWILDTAPRQPASLRDVARAVISRQRPAAFAQNRAINWPDDPKWLASTRQRSRIVDDYLNQCSGPRGADRRSAIEGIVDNRTAFKQILALASDMDALRGHRHHFVSFAKALLAGDDDRIESGNRPAVESAQRYEMLHALIAQLPAFGTASGDRQTVADVMTLVLQQLEKRHLLPHHKARLAKELIEVTGHLATSRYSGSDAHQSHALDAIKAGLAHLRGGALASLLQELLLSREGWSAERGAHSLLPRSRGQKRSMGWSAVLPPITVAAGVTVAWRTAVGRSSPKSKALDVALDALERDVAWNLRERTTQSAAFLPLYRELLRSLSTTAEQGDAKSQTHLARVLGCVVQGTLPTEIDARQRDQLFSQVIGDDPAWRATLVKTLTVAVKERKGAASTPLARIHAARYLQNLLACGTGGLGDAERKAAQAAIDRAVASKSADWTNARQRSVLLAMIREAQRDGMPVRPEAASVAAANLLLGLRPQTFIEDAREAASTVPPLLQLYPLLDERSRAGFRTALHNIAPEVPAPRGPAARNQLPLLSFATSLARFKGGAEAAEELTGLLKAVWPRLNDTNQQAALHDMFEAYDEATPEARDALLSVVAQLEDERHFVSGAIALLANALPSTASETASHETQARRVIDTVLNRIPDLSDEALSDLASHIVRDSGPARQALIDGFLAAAGRLEPRSLAEVLSAELDRLGTLSAEEVAAAANGWRAMADAMDDSKATQRDTLRLFANVATGASSDADADRVVEGAAMAVAVPAAAASQLLAVLPTLPSPMQATALRYISGEGAPADIRDSVVDNLFRDFATADAARRTLAIELGGPTAVGRALEALATAFGAPQLHNGTAVTRPDLDQPFLASGGPDGSLQTLRSALMAPQRRPQEIAVALEAMADRFQALPLAYQRQFRELFEERGRQLPDALRGRVITTLALANPSLAEKDEFSAIGRELLDRHRADGVPGVAAVRLVGGRINNADAALAALRRTRLSSLKPAQVQSRNPDSTAAASPSAG